MKKLLTLILIISFLFCNNQVAIIYFEIINVSNEETNALTKKLTSELMDLGESTVVGRTEIPTFRMCRYGLCC